mmetsp:Transcript_2306/g.6256  ORF Transcript_2306/g.6256 Transcript_2306/m.6256 type:complete len:145 (+) Transcript_2306:411-845(+)
MLNARVEAPFSFLFSHTYLQSSSHFVLCAIKKSTIHGCVLVVFLRIACVKRRSCALSSTIRTKKWAHESTIASWSCGRGATHRSLRSIRAQQIPEQSLCARAVEATREDTNRLALNINASEHDYRCAEVYGTRSSVRRCEFHST